MKISRNKVPDCDLTIYENCKQEGASVKTETEVIVETAISPEAEAKDLIRQAIDTLAQVAQQNDVAKEAIANLSVVLLELQ